MAAPIVVSETYDASPDVVWRAITDADEMRQWFFETMEEFRPEPGFETKFNVHHDGRDYLHIWRVTEVEPQQKIVYGWRYGGHPGESTVTWQLTPVAGGTRLELSHVGVESFPQDDPAFRRESCRGGWECFIQERLKAHLDHR